MWTIGQLARRAGVTVRTLHHYDDIGLLRASARSGAGYRLYSEADARRLARVLMLRRLGLGLSEIRAQLDDGAATPDVLSKHIERLRRELAEGRTLLRRLEAIQATLAAGGHDLELIMEAVAMIEKHYTQEQLDALASRRAEIGEETIASVEREWGEIFAGFGEAMARGDAPDTPENLARARRSIELVEAFTGGDPEVAASLGQMYEAEGPEKVLEGHHAMDPALWAYMEAAKDAL